jgi:hypothetical protein
MLTAYDAVVGRNNAGSNERSSRSESRSDPDSTLQRLAGLNDLATVIMAALAADVMRALQLAAVPALVVRLGRKRLMAPAHAGT